jgi:hypothetical protein
VTKTTRNLVAGLAVTVATAGAVRVAAASEAAGMADPERRVRTSSPVLAQLINDATERSDTFRGLIETIRTSDGIVYVEEGDCGHGVRACLVAVSAAGPNRILWVKVDTRKSDWDLMGSIGHELRHAVEVLDNPAVTSNAALYFFYARVGRTGTTGAFETEAAVQAGHAVRAEVRRPTVIAQVQ